MVFSALVLFLAVVLLAAAHYIKTLRWRALIEIYEIPSLPSLCKSLAIGYIINFFFPFRVVGEIVRALFSGRKMKNGISFSLVTILWDRFMDVFAVSVLFALLLLHNPQNGTLAWGAAFYFAVSLLIVICSALIVKMRRSVKRFLQIICSAFNSKIELASLLFFWGMISSFKDIVYKLNTKLLLLYTTIMWILYLCSYWLYQIFIASVNMTFTFENMMIFMFAPSNLFIPYVVISENIWFYFYFTLYILSALAIITVMAAFLHPKEQAKDKTVNLIPFLNESDKIFFLHAYFSGDNRDQISEYLSINRDVFIMADYSAGSNATTLLCMSKDGMFFRKMAFSPDAKKLSEQISWLEEFKNKLPLPNVINKKFEQNYCYYDMEYEEGVVGSFDFVHIVPIERAWAVIESALMTLSDKLHLPSARNQNPSKISEYIEEKITKNWISLKKARCISDLMQFNTLIINNEEYKNLPLFEEMMSYDHLMDVFQYDCCSDIHGDFTIENIIYKMSNQNNPEYYFIDPNTGNIHDTPYLDYAKLLQSLHGEYEFFSKTQSITIENNQISFLDLSTAAYKALQARYKVYLLSRFGEKGMKSIFYHEIAHWLRLMPYKISKNEMTAVVYFTGLVKVINDVDRIFNEEVIS